ncbi:unnamed protein product [Coffea canephora]|uniref:DH200=94 genomic scaffold, scaffold_5403 n=1 Tax=Coffea canephora TaxID=49390 RepID=A0A068VLR4_COFCA|nr:unnamed protein product [Coffea canephora]
MVIKIFFSTLISLPINGTFSSFPFATHHVPQTTSASIRTFPHPFSTQAQPITQNSENAEKDNQEEEDNDDEREEEEFSKTRILAQNVPWTSTVDGLHPFFEKYGTVVDIELSMYNKTRNRGLAFVRMASHKEVLATFKNLESYVSIFDKSRLFLDIVFFMALCKILVML